MKKSVVWIGLLVIVLMMSSLACNIGGNKEPTATPVPPTSTPAPATDTPEPIPTQAEASPTVEAAAPTAAPKATKAPSTSEGMVQAESETQGVRLEYPEGWFYDDSFFIVMSSAADANPMESDTMPDAVVVFVMAGPADEVNMDGSSPDEMFGDLVNEFSGDTEAEIIDGPREDTINGVPVQIVEFSAVEEGQEAHGKAVIFDAGELAAVAIAISPEEMWKDYEDQVNAIFESIELFEGTGFNFGPGTAVDEGEVRGSLMDGAVVEDELSEAAVHAWTFAGSAGQYATAILTPLGDDMDVTLQLLAADSTLLSETDDGFSGEPEVLSDYVLPDSGEYRIVVKEFFAAAGGYTIEFYLSDEPHGPVFESGTLDMGPIGQEVVSGSLAEGENHVWRYSATAGEVVDIILTPLDGGMDMALTVMDPTGVTVVELYDNAFSDEPEELFGLVLDQSGDYSIIVEEYWDEVGNYSLEVRPGEAGVTGDSGEQYEWVDMGTITYGSSQDASLPEGKYVHEWLFDGKAGDVVTIIATPLTSDADLQLALIDSAGDFLFDLDDYVEGQPEGIYSFSLPSTGTYSIAVAEYWEVYAEYALTLTKE